MGHVLAASLGMILISLVGLGLFLPHDIHLSPSIGLTSIIFALVYFIALRLIYQYNKNHPTVSENEINPAEKFTLKEIIFKYSIFALIIIGAAIFLPHFAEQISNETGMEKAFVGTLFLAISTSLPEIAVSIAAVRMGSIDMAVGNLLGSNIFNVMILFIDDLFYTKGLLLKDAASNHIVSVFSVGIMSAIAIIGLTYRAEGKRYLMAWDTFLIFIVYILNIVILYFG
jgi:cation:H+ antiporter